MYYFRVSILLLGMALTDVSAQISLNPLERTHEGEGGTTTYFVFTDGEIEISIIPEPAWKISAGTQSRANFLHVEKAGEVVAYIEAKESGFPTTMDALKKAIAGALPEDAAPIGEVSAVPGWTMMGAPTWILSAEYLSQGETLSKRSLYLTYEEQQWIFSLVCEPASLEEMWQSFSNVIGSFSFNSVDHLTPVVMVADDATADPVVP